MLRDLFRIREAWPPEVRASTVTSSRSAQKGTTPPLFATLGFCIDKLDLFRGDPAGLDAFVSQMSSDLVVMGCALDAPRSVAVASLSYVKELGDYSQGCVLQFLSCMQLFPCAQLSCWMSFIREYLPTRLNLSCSLS
jgi:hypothetical protein